VAKITKAIASGWLADVPQDKLFWCADGQALKNLSELQAALNGMSSDTFCYHLNETKNDFSNWVRDVIGDEQLSKDLKKSKTQIQAAKIVADRVIWLKSKIKAA
jgi:hypothetical protein